MYFALGVIAAILISCGASAPEESTVKWGHLKYAASAPLLNIPPGGTIGVCGPYAREVSTAILTWAEVINRADRINIRYSCRYAKHIKTEAWSQASICRQFRLPSNCNIVGFAGGSQLVLRKDYSLNNNLVLHEVGHMWGMCDQYRGSTRDGWMNNCSTRFRSIRRHGESAMGSATRGRTRLTMDDIRGVRELASRRDIPMNQQWK